MPEFPNPAGGRMTVANESEARAAGWSPSMGSFGSDSYPQANLGGGGGGGGGAPQTYGSVDTSKISQGFAASAGISIKQLDEQIREFDQTLEWQKKMWEQQGLPQLAIQQRAADLEEKKFAELTQQAVRQQDFVEEQGRRQAALAEKTQADANVIAQGQLNLGQQTLGLDTMKTAASLGGPADWIKAANFSRGVQGTQLPAFITQLLTGTPTAVLGGPAPGATMSDVQSMGGLANQLGAQGGGTSMGAPTGSNVDFAAQMLKQVFANGGQALGPQQLEGLTPSELAMFQGGGESVGADVPGWLEQYKRSRIGQASAVPGM